MLQHVTMLVVRQLHPEKEMHAQFSVCCFFPNSSAVMETDIGCKKLFNKSSNLQPFLLMAFDTGKNTLPTQPLLNLVKGRIEVWCFNQLVGVCKYVAIWRSLIFSQQPLLYVLSVICIHILYPIPILGALVRPLMEPSVVKMLCPWGQYTILHQDQGGKWIRNFIGLGESDFINFRIPEMLAHFGRFFSHSISTDVAWHNSPSLIQAVGQVIDPYKSHKSPV